MVNWAIWLGIIARKKRNYSGDYRIAWQSRTRSNAFGQQRVVVIGSSGALTNKVLVEFDPVE
jgi:hypothetical protein